MYEPLTNSKQCRKLLLWAKNSEKDANGFEAIYWCSAYVLAAAEIEHISDMFQEKQQELQVAVQKVEQLTQQLEDLRKGKLNGFQTYNGQMTGPAAIELKKLYQELQVSGIVLKLQ